MNPASLEYPSQRLFRNSSNAFEDLGFLEFQVLLSYLSYLSIHTHKHNFHRYI